MGAIITHGLYIFYPILKGQKCFFKELFFANFYPYVRLLFKSGLLSSAGYDGQCTVHSIIFGAFNSTTASMLTVGHPVAVLLNLILHLIDLTRGKISKYNFLKSLSVTWPCLCF